jgi:hypothetical protein
MLTLPRHANHDGVNNILIETERLIRNMHEHSRRMRVVDPKLSIAEGEGGEGGEFDAIDDNRDEEIYANTYVDLGKVDAVGFDYDYTLVTYTNELLDLIYDKALRRLVNDRQYPLDMLDAGLSFDPYFSIRGALGVFRWCRCC